MNIPNTEYYRVTLRIVDRNLDPQKITKLLEMEPSKSHKRGDAFPKHPNRSRPYGYWGIASNLPETENLRNHLDSILEKFKGKEKILNLLKKECETIEILCGFFTTDGDGSPLSLDPNQMRAISELGINLEIRYYYIEVEREKNGIAS